MEVDPADVFDVDLGRGELQVRAWPEQMPESGTRVEFSERSWVVTRRNVRTPGGRSVFVAVLLPAATP